MKVANRIWEIAYPVLMYYAAISIGIMLAQMVFGMENESYMICKIIGSMIALTVVYQDYKNDRVMSGQYGVRIPVTKTTIVDGIAMIGITLCLSISLNNILSMSPLVTMSQEYQNASNALYGSRNLFLELFGSALITPILEEMLHRGVVYDRLRRRMHTGGAILISALIFAVLHFNVVQFIYAFLLGVVFAIFKEKAKSIYAPIIAHVIANGVAVIRTETGILQNTVDGSGYAWMISLGLLIIGMGILYIAFVKDIWRSNN